jgi:hypothetical protein
MTQADAGGHPDVMVSGKLIGAVENCYRPPTLRLSKGLDKAFGLVQFYEGIYASIKRESGIPSDFWEYTEQETLASFIKIYENFLITGLLQTKEYAREIVRAGLRAGDPARQSGQRARSTLRSDRIRRTADRGLGETDPHGLGGHAMMFDLSSTQWRKSSRSGSSGEPVRRGRRPRHRHRSTRQQGPGRPEADVHTRRMENLHDARQSRPARPDLKHNLQRT